MEFYQTTLVTLRFSKIFLQLSNTYYVCLRVTLGPYLSSEASGVVARRFKRKLFRQTAENDDFLHVILIFTIISLKAVQKQSLSNPFSDFEGREKNFCDVLACTMCVCGMPQVHIYPLKQAEWPDDASIEIYCRKQPHMVILIFYSQFGRIFT